MGFSVNGKLAPEIENPAPLTVSALIVTAAVPVEVRVTVCVVAEFTFMLPNATVEALTLRVGVLAPNCNAKVFALPPALAVSVTLCDVLTEFTVAVNPTLVCPAGILIETGTVTAGLLLVRPTVNPPLAAAAFNVAVQLSVPAPVMEPLLQVSPARTGTPVPLSAMVVVVPVNELLVNVSEPDAVPAAVGSNCTVNVAVWFGLSVNGKLAPETENPAPLTASALIVTAAVPVDDRVTVCVVAEFTLTLPNDTVEALTPSVGTLAPICSAKVFVLPPALAVSVTLCDVLTELTVAVNPALVCPAEILMDAGTVTAELLLDRPTVNPPLAAAVFSVAVQLSVPAPVMEPLEQISAARTGTPVPLKLTAVEAPVEELLVSVSEPDAAPAAVGSNCTVNVAV